MCVVRSKNHLCSFQTRANFFPQTTLFFIHYTTKKELENIILCCKNYFKSAFFEYHGLFFDGNICNIMLETQSSLYWESIEELELQECNIKTIIRIITEINLPNLKYMELRSLNTECKIDNHVRSEVKNNSLQWLSISLDKCETYAEPFSILLRCLPNLTEFNIILRCDLSTDFPISALPKGLRSLYIFTYFEIESLDLLNDLSNFPLLTKLNLRTYSKKIFNFNLNKTIYLPNLTEIITSWWVLQSATFVLLEVRKLDIYYPNNSSLDYLKNFKKLKNIEFNSAKVGTAQKIIDSNFLSSFPNLNKFCCDDYTVFYEKYTYKLARNIISKSLIDFNVYDGGNRDYYCENENAKKLQEEKIPFLYKYNSGFMENPACILRNDGIILRIRKKAVNYNSKK